MEGWDCSGASHENSSVDDITPYGKFEFNEGALEPIDSDRSIAWQDRIS